MFRDPVTGWRKHRTGPGTSVAIDETQGLLVVGAKRDDDGGQNAGAVYLFARDQSSQWQPDGKVVASDAAINKWFGESISARGSTVIIGGSEEPAFSPGAAYLYSSRLFADGFESGDTTAWTTTEP